jgi:hypothetical protein
VTFKFGGWAWKYHWARDRDCWQDGPHAVSHSALTSQFRLPVRDPKISTPLGSLRNTWMASDLQDADVNQAVTSWLQTLDTDVLYAWITSLDVAVGEMFVNGDDDDVWCAHVLYTCAHVLYTCAHVLYTCHMCYIRVTCAIYVSHVLYTCAHVLYTCAHVLYTCAHVLYTCAHMLYTCHMCYIRVTCAPSATHVLYTCHMCYIRVKVRIRFSAAEC